MTMTRERIGPATVWTGGQGETLLLVHGAWGGAALHWAPVWERLAERFRVLAPELPGIGDDGDGLPSFEAYAEWLRALVGDTARLFCVGNSFGAAVAWQLAARLGDRCRGLVLVNGVPPPALPSPLRALASLPSLRPWLRALFRRLNFSPRVLSRAFADPAHAPPELLRVVAAPPPARMDLLVRVLLAATPPAPRRPSLPIALLWGASDRLPGTTAASARTLQRILNANLTLLPAAGHCPQLEQPAQFTRAIEAFVDAASDGGGDAASSTGRTGEREVG